MKISGTKPHCSLTTALISICLLLLSICSAQGNAFSYNPGGRSDEDFKRTIITTRGIEHAGNILYATDSLLVLWESTQPYNLDNLDEFATALPFYEIERVVIEKKGHFWSTAGKGFLIGGGIGALIGLASGDDEEGFIRFTAGQKAISLGIGIGLSSALISGIIDAINNIDDDFPIRGNPGKFKAILPILKKHAIFPSMPPYEVQVLLSKKSEEITTTSVKPIVQIGKEKTIPSAAKVHISVGSALTLTQANNDIIDAFESSGFGGRVGGFFGSIDYPVDHSRLFGYSLNGEYSLSERFLIGIEMAKIPRQEIHGKWGSEQEFGYGSSYSLLVEYVPSPIAPLLTRRFESKIGAGLCYNLLTVDGTLSLELYGSSIVHTPGYFKVEKTMIGGHIRGSLDYYLSRRLSLQGKIDLRLMPEGISVPATNYEGKTLRQHTVNFSSMGFSIGLAVHF